MIKVGKLAKSISEELDSSSEIHDFKLVITCANSSSATQLEVFSKVDELIIEFKKKVPNIARYVELLKESI